MTTNPLDVARGRIDRPHERYVREPAHDRRIRRGDDFAGDAWRDSATKEIRYVAVGHNPNTD